MLRTETDITGQLWSGCIIIKNEEDAKKIITRLKRIYSRVPLWLKRPISTDRALSFGFEGGGYFEGLNAGGKGPRQEGYSVGIMDEAAFQMRARENYGALRQCARKTVVNSTANGTGNLHHDLISGIIPGAHKIRIHYSAHPYRDQSTDIGRQWKKRAMIGQSHVDWQREMEINYETFAEEGWFIHDFREECVVDELEWDGRAIINISFDPGYAASAAMVSFVNSDHQWCRLQEYIRHNLTTEEFCQEVFDDCRAQYPSAKFRLCCDPYGGAQRKTVRDSGGANTDVDVINRTAYNVLEQRAVVQNDRVPELRRADGHRLIRRQFALRADEKPGTLIDRNGCKLFISGLRGGYRQTEKPTARQLELEEPNRSSDHVHLFDADRYAVVQFTTETGVTKYTQSQPVQEPVMTTIFDPETGYVRGVG